MTQDRIFYFKCTDSADKEAWMEAIENTMTRSTDMVDNNMEEAKHNKFKEHMKKEMEILERILQIDQPYF